jgi:hypothetical protein
MLLIFILMTFVLTVAGCGVIAWLACRRIARHLQGNADGVKAVTDHILLPLLTRKREPEENRDS